MLKIDEIVCKNSKISCKKRKEFLAYGIMNVLSAFFGGFPGAISLARCIIFENVGGRTQIYGFFSGVIVLIVILLLGEFLSCEFKKLFFSTKFSVKDPISKRFQT